ncbi:MAG: helix-turn-helix domain-containing protein [Micromonosporaceae bacterium]
MLEAAGIEPSEERVYRMLIGARDADVATVAHRLALDPATAESLLTSLAAKGLVSRISGSPPRFVPVPPDVALGPVLLRSQEALEWARRDVAQLAEEYRAGVRRHDAGHLVEVITGAAAIRQQLRNLAYGAREEIRWFCKAGHVAMSSQDNDEEFEMLAKSVRYRVLYERALLEQPGMVDNVALGIRAGEVARATATLPVRLAIADGTMAICPLVSGTDDGSTSGFGEPTAAVVRGSSLLDALVALFESYWATASPLHVTDTGELADYAGVARPGATGATLADDEQYLLSLIVAGVADKAIASQLRVSHRTVQRRIRDLMERVGAHTRTQLVWQAARRGWLA